MKFKLFVMAISTVVFSACGGGESTETRTTSTTTREPIFEIQKIDNTLHLCSYCYYCKRQQKTMQKIL